MIRDRVSIGMFNVLTGEFIQILIFYSTSVQMLKDKAVITIKQAIMKFSDNNNAILAR